MKIKKKKRRYYVSTINMAKNRDGEEVGKSPKPETALPLRPLGAASDLVSKVWKRAIKS